MCSAKPRAKATVTEWLNWSCLVFNKFTTDFRYNRNYLRACGTRTCVTKFLILANCAAAQALSVLNTSLLGVYSAPKVSLATYDHLIINSTIKVKRALSGQITRTSQSFTTKYKCVLRVDKLRRIALYIEPLWAVRIKLVAWAVSRSTLADGKWNNRCLILMTAKAVNHPSVSVRHKNTQNTNPAFERTQKLLSYQSRLHLCSVLSD